MFYIGAHKTKNKNDGYMGSGKNIRNAIEQDGLEHFQKEILYECSSTREMYKKERELVIVNPNISYNLKKGGDGGFDYIHRKLRFKGANAFRKKLKNDKKFRKTYSEKMQKIMLKKYSDGMINPFLGKKHTIKTKQTIGAITTKSQKGKRNSQFGTKWIYNKDRKSTRLNSSHT